MKIIEANVKKLMDVKLMQSCYLVMTWEMCPNRGKIIIIIIIDEKKVNEFITQSQ